MKKYLLISSFLVTSLFALPLHAQTTPATPAQASTSAVPEEMPYDIAYGTSITLADAKKLVEAAQAESQKHNWKHAIVVVDPSGNLICLVKMDNTQLASVQIAIKKATTAARMRRPTKVIQQGANSGNVASVTLPGVLPIEGGIPLIVDNKIVGAIGASGGTAAQDTVVAEAGLAVLKNSQ